MKKFLVTQKSTNFVFCIRKKKQKTKRNFVRKSYSAALCSVCGVRESTSAEAHVFARVYPDALGGLCRSQYRFVPVLRAPYPLPLHPSPAPISGRNIIVDFCFTVSISILWQRHPSSPVSGPSLLFILLIIKFWVDTSSMIDSACTVYPFRAQGGTGFGKTASRSARRRRRRDAFLALQYGLRNGGAGLRFTSCVLVRPSLARQVPHVA